MGSARRTVRPDTLPHKPLEWTLDWRAEVPRRNYGFEKRQKEMNKQRKRDEKLQRKLDRATNRVEREPGDPEAPPESQVES